MNIVEQVQQAHAPPPPTGPQQVPVVMVTSSQTHLSAQQRSAPPSSQLSSQTSLGSRANTPKMAQAVNKWRRQTRCVSSGGSKGWPGEGACDALPPPRPVARYQGYIVAVFTAWHRKLHHSLNHALCQSGILAPPKYRCGRHPQTAAAKNAPVFKVRSTPFRENA